MAEVIFSYQGNEIKVQCFIDETMKDICQRFVNKMNLDINKLIFLYAGNNIKFNFTFNKQANNEDKIRKKMNEFVNSIEEKDIDSKSKLIQSKEIICSNCGNVCTINVNDYKIILYECENNHLETLLFDEFEKSQFIDESKILCDKCNNNNKGNSFKGQFFKCLSCNLNLCPLCQSQHMRNHNIVNYEDKNYICSKHSEKFDSYCKICHKNYCMFCSGEHDKNHQLIYFRDMLPDINKIGNELNELKIKIDKFKNEIQKIINLLIEVKTNFDIYYNINERIIKNYEFKNRNFQILNTLNNISNSNKKIISDINNFLNENNKEFKINNIIRMHNQFFKKHFNDSKSQNLETSRKWTTEPSEKKEMTILRQEKPDNEIVVIEEYTILGKKKEDNVIEERGSLTILSVQKKDNDLDDDSDLNDGEIYKNEKECFSKLINYYLKNDIECKDILPINHKSKDIYKKIKNGLILYKLINIIKPGIIDKGIINKKENMTIDFQKFILNIIINSVKFLGCFIDITADDILNEVVEKDIDLLFQLFKLIFAKNISIEKYPQLLRLKNERENDEDILKLGLEDFLKRWFNYHLSKTKYHNIITNFGDDLKDSQNYIILLNQLDPNKCNIEGLNERDLKKRARIVLENAMKIGVKVYIKDQDIQNGNENLNLLFICLLFMANNSLGKATKEEKIIVNEILEDDDEGRREEISFRTWINSLKLEGVKKVNNLYQECRNAILLLKIIDKFKPGTVNWKYVELKTKNPFKIAVNCQEVIDSAKRSGFSIISIMNKDIQEGRKKHILAIVWQLMKAHTLKVIGERGEEELIAWANSKVSEPRKIKNLKEKKLSDGLFWIELLSSIKPKSIKWNLVVKENITDEDREMNAKYALSVSRGLGSINFLFWEDITEVKSKLLLSFLASIYNLDKNH